MKPFLTLLAGLLAAGFIAGVPAAAQQQDPRRSHDQSHDPSHNPPRYPPRDAPHDQPPPPPRPPNSLGEGWRQQQDEVRQGVRQRQIMPLGTAIEMLRRRVPGRQLDAGLEYQGAREVYRVRWMTFDGRRIDYIIDAQTGQVLSGQ